MKRGRVADWASLLRPGDVAMLIVAIAFCTIAALALWRGGAPDKAIVRASGKVFAELGLTRAQVVEVPGPLGVTRIEVEPGRARVVSDPGPRQYCVRQGWLSRAGSVAICAPNQVSLSLSGGAADYDSLHY